MFCWSKSWTIFNNFCSTPSVFGERSTWEMLKNIFTYVKIKNSEAGFPTFGFLQLCWTTFKVKVYVTPTKWQSRWTGLSGFYFTSNEDGCLFLLQYWHFLMGATGIDEQLKYSLNCPTNQEVSRENRQENLNSFFARFHLLESNTLVWNGADGNGFHRKAQCSRIRLSWTKRPL